MEDSQITHHIKNLTAEEQRLWEKTDLNTDEIKKLDQIKLELDQCWDLLRQRRALRDAHQNPNKAETRDIETIENYEE